jgi:hypothetical protein
VQQLGERQRGFAAALLDPELPMPDGLVGPNGEPDPKRFALYRNNVVASLIEALADAFPAVHRIVGADFFRAMACAYAMVQPPRSPIMLDYGAGFPDFIRSFEPAAVLPYLEDIARIERAWTEAYHAPEASPIDPSAFGEVAPDQLPAIQLELHPSLRVVRSQFPALTIWQMNVADGIPAPVDLAAGGEDALIIRPAADVEARLIPKGSVEFIQALSGGKPVLAALEASLIANPRFDLSANLSDLMRAGAIVSYGLAQEHPT